MPIVVTSQRFRTRNQFWSYCGLGIVMCSSSDWVQSPNGGWMRVTPLETNQWPEFRTEALGVEPEGMVRVGLMHRSAAVVDAL